MLHRVLVDVDVGRQPRRHHLRANAPITGYVAFFTLVCISSACCCCRAADAGPGPAIRSLPSRALDVLADLVASGGFDACRQNADHGARRSAGRRLSARRGRPPRSAPQRSRRTGLAAARVPIAQAALDSNPPDRESFDEDDVLECRPRCEGMGGTTPKFDCELPGHDVVRVKYGRGNPELHAEIAATRLLSALGFGADRMSVVKKVRCAGCTVFPFQSLKCLAETGLEKACFPGGHRLRIRYRDFDAVSIERRLDGRRIESTPDQGWACFEIDQMDEAAGGSPKAHVDALKLLAVVLAHWDNKAENQRLLCLPGGDLPDGGCSKPFAILQDLGASFGPTKLDLHNWRSTPIWADPRSCLVSMKQCRGAGRRFRIRASPRRAASSCCRCSSSSRQPQLRDLFAGARVESSEGVTAEGASRQRGRRRSWTRCGRFARRGRARLR